MTEDFSKTYVGKLRKIVGSDFRIKTVGVWVLIENDKNELLMQKRADDNTWSFICGGSEMTDVVTAAKQETLEETGLKIGYLTPFGFVSKPEHGFWTYPNGDKIFGNSMLFWTKDYSGKENLDSIEVVDLVWKNIEDIKEDFFDEIQSWMVFNALKEYKKTGKFQLI